MYVSIIFLQTINIMLNFFLFPAMSILFPFNMALKLWMLYFPGGSDGKASVYNAGDPGSSPGLGRSPGEGNSNPLQYYCLENPMERGAWKAAVYGVAKSWTRLSDFTSLHFTSVHFTHTHTHIYIYMSMLYVHLRSISECSAVPSGDPLLQQGNKLINV